MKATLEKQLWMGFLKLKTLFKPRKEKLILSNQMAIFKRNVVLEIPHVPQFFIFLPIKKLIVDILAVLVHVSVEFDFNAKSIVVKGSSYPIWGLPNIYFLNYGRKSGQNFLKFNY